MKSIRSLASILVISGAALLVWSCGGTNGGPEGDRNYDGTSFVDTDGSIEVVLNDEELDVADETGFSVRVRDTSGDPVPNIEIACDTEQGLALIEPTTGFEMTDDNGQMSGRVGCVTPGSYRMGCRLPSGAYKRNFKTIRCNGPIPPGFTGWEGAGGGGLGNGGSGGGGGSADDSGRVVQISNVTASDGGNDSTTSIDVTRQTCGSGADATAEPFTDATLSIQVRNNTDFGVNFFAFSYEVEDADGAGNSFSSREVGLSGGGNVTAGAETTLTALFIEASGAGKRFTGASSNIPSDLGFRSIKINLRGINAAGEDVEASAIIGLSFGNFDNCASS